MSKKPKPGSPPTAVQVETFARIAARVQRNRLSFPVWPDSPIEQAVVVAEHTTNLLSIARQARVQPRYAESLRDCAVTLAALCVRLIEESKGGQHS